MNFSVTCFVCDASLKKFWEALETQVKIAALFSEEQYCSAAADNIEHVDFTFFLFQINELEKSLIFTVVRKTLTENCHNLYLRNAAVHDA